LSRDDDFVRYTGCCTDPTKPECCCKISQKSPEECVDARTAFNEWAAFVNQCDKPENAPASHTG
jgi:hypothetical protein